MQKKVFQLKIFFHLYVHIAGATYHSLSFENKIDKDESSFLCHVRVHDFSDETTRPRDMLFFYLPPGGR